jgi:uncharacterized protein involved in exopolysaccharide biosynthesis
MLDHSPTSLAPTDSPASRPGKGMIRRKPWREISAARILTGGRLGDLGRLPRYAAIFAMGATLIWAPIIGYLKTAPLKYKSELSLILPGSGASASVNLSDIGQASSYANSAFSSNSISPTETYKRLIAADRILEKAAQSLGISIWELGSPRIDLVDQTSLIHVSMTGPSPISAQERGDALLAAFFAEIDALRADELAVRETSGAGAMDDYRASVLATREEIARLQSETGLISSSQYAAQISANDERAQAAQTMSTTLDQRRGEVLSLGRMLGLTPELAAATLKLFADAEYNAITQEIALHATTLAEAEAKLGARHPDVESARRAYEGARAKALARAEFVTNLPASELATLDLAPAGARAELLSAFVRKDSELAGLTAEYAALSADLASETARLQALAPLAAQLEDKQRDFSVAEAVFASAIARTQSTKADVYASYPLVQVLEDPSLPQEPSSPRRMLAIAAGIAALVLLLIGLTLGWIRRAVIGRLIGSDRVAQV